MPFHPEFSEATLAELLRALRTRTAQRPDDPGLIASWPGVREDRMAAACTELVRRGHDVSRVPVPNTALGRTRNGWTLALDD